jgi:hypothetical protein
MNKQVLVLTDIPSQLLEAGVASLQLDNVKVVRFIPHVKFDITYENPCIFAFLDKPPGEALSFLLRNRLRRPVEFFFSSEAYRYMDEKIIQLFVTPGLVFIDREKNQVIKAMLDYLVDFANLA